MSNVSFAAVALTSALLAVGAPSAGAQAPAKAPSSTATSAPGRHVKVDTLELSATVENIDRAKRSVTLKGTDGGVLKLDVGPKVKNFEHIKVGDHVVARYFEALSLELKKGGGAQVVRTETALGDTAAPGARPAVAGAQGTRVVADVVAVDAATHTVTLRGPKQTVTLKVRDPKQFELVKPGDQVEAILTRAVAVEIVPAKK